MNQIIAPVDAIYCSEFMNELPQGIINKKNCGCGLTSLAIEDKYPTVIVVPTVEIIKNKEAQYPNDRCNHFLLGVYKGVDSDLVEYYLKDLNPSLPPKILVTYDSFGKVAQVIARNESKYRIVVDEFSELLDAYGYRDKAINSLLGRLESFSYVSYISATPMDRKYYPPQLQGIQETEIVWHKPTEITVYRRRSPRPRAKVLEIIQAYLMAGEQGLPMPNGHRSHVAYFFINSVSLIKKILDSVNLPEDQVRVICSKKDANRKALSGYSIGSAFDTEKKFNFITSTAFKGSDFYSDSGLVFIVSDVHKKSTMLSIDVDVKQINGRIRTASNPFKNFIVHIYNVNNSLLTKGEFEALVDQKIVKTKDLIDSFAQCTTTRQKKHLQESLKENTKDHYLRFSMNGSPVLDDYLVKNDWRKWETSHAIYCDGHSIREAYQDAGISLKGDQIYDSTPYHLSGTKRFKTLCMAYIKGDSDREYIAAIEPLVKQAYESLGESKMKSLCFRKRDIQKALTDTAPAILESLERQVHSSFEVGKSYTLADTKTTLASIYAELGLQKTAKATDLKKYFAIKDCKKRIDGKSTGMIEIVASV
ncbi:MAG: hypothetical protein WCO45_11940 [Pseudanabaena sp. ELA607]|jgi:hypothetical protein